MKSKKGFTLIELLVVIAIIGILAAIVLVSLRGAPARAKDARIKSDINQARTQAELIYTDNNVYNELCASDTLNEVSTNYGSKLGALENDIAAQQGVTPPVMHCQASGNSFCISARMVIDNTKYFCVDSDGRVVENAASTKCTAAAISCQ